MSKVAVIVPTLNAGKDWQTWLQAFAAQTCRGDYRLVIDSSSTDDTRQLAVNQGFHVHVIAKSEFNHGGTRQLAVNLLEDAEIIVFLTQDAILSTPDAIEKLLACFDDPEIAVAYGRQLPHLNAGPIAAHARLFNYPEQTQIRSLADQAQYGIKTVFISNSFAAYRRSALLEAGGFPPDTIMNEDTFVAAKMLLNGWKMAYCAEAQVYHSHDYNFLQEFKRYFDIGVFHANAAWLRATFGGAGGEGLRYIKSEIKYLSAHQPWIIPSAMFRSLLKYLGFKLGLLSRRGLPLFLCRNLSLHKGYWYRYN